MNCREVLAKLYDYLDAELSVDEKKQVQTHLEICGHCLEQYKLEEDFNKLVQQKIKSPTDVAKLKSRVLAEIEKIDHGTGGGSSRRSMFFLIAPVAAAALITLFLVNPFSSQGSMLQVVYPYATEHNKCLDHVLKYLVKSDDPQVVQAALAGLGDVPADLFQSPHGEFRLAGASVVHTEHGERPHIDYDYNGTDISVFVLDPNTVDKSPFRRVEHNGKVLYIGSCPKFHYVMWECERHECIAVSKLEEENLLSFASTF